MNDNCPRLKDRKVISFLVEDQYRLCRHFAFLLGFFVLIYNAHFSYQYSGVYRYYALFLVYISFLVMVYVNIYVLVPFFLFKSKYVAYFVLLMALGILGLNFIAHAIDIYFEPHKFSTYIGRQYSHGIYEGGIMCIPMILVTTTIKLLQKWTKDNESIVELRNLTLTMELNELKNQINPHFLFNMLNNVKALIRSNPETAVTVIIKLSEFLRYQLYENNAEKTSLIAEVNFISNFLNLEKIRRDNFIFTINNQTNEPVFRNVFIPPNLFTTFLENAVKHSVDITGRETYIKIDISVEKDSLHFRCINSKKSDYTVPDKRYSGLGLMNIKRRLEILYPNKYSLDIAHNHQEYSINLIIPV